MAGKKGSRSSKTAHVLNLLSGRGAGGAGAAPGGGDRADGGAAGRAHASPPPRERPILPPIVEVARTNSEALSETIRSALEKELEEEQAQERALERAEEAGRNMRPSPPQSRRRNRSGPMTRQSPAPSAPMPPKASPMQEQKPVEQGLPDGAEWVNVMLGLVEEKAERYVKMFGLCPCPRCVADVKALALTRLPAKYVVLPAEHKKPMLSLYQARYDGDVTTQVIYACKAVMDAPRHGAAQPGLASDRG